MKKATKIENRLISDATAILGQDEDAKPSGDK